MMCAVPRPYRMKARAETADATRRRILDAAREAILDGLTPELSVGDVARRAGVARSTIYSLHGSRAGLIGAVIVDALMRAGFEQTLQLFNLPDAAEGMRRALPEGARMMESFHELARRINVLAQLDAEIMAVQQTADQSRADGMRYQAGRLAEQGRLRRGVTAEQAAMILYLLTDLMTYDSLRSRWNLDPSQIGEFMVDVAERYLIRD